MCRCDKQKMMACVCVGGGGSVASARVRCVHAAPWNFTRPPTTAQPRRTPGSVKALHLFEARYLALLDAVLAAPGPNKLLGFVVVEQPGEPFGETAAGFPGAYAGDTYVLTMATLVRVRVACCGCGCGLGRACLLALRAPTDNNNNKHTHINTGGGGAQVLRGCDGAHPG